MDKDEMKNRISLALKDPILQQGFEVICKENAELKARIDNLKDEFEYSENYGKRVQGERHRLVNDNAKLREQLTKAKEIIKTFLDSSDLNIKHKAEEFLGEF